MKLESAMKVTPLVLVLSMVALGDVASAQVIAGQNVSIVDSDPFSQKQLEVDAAANPLNPNHIFAGYINYRTALESPGSVTSVGSCGWSFSTNGGKTWKNGFVDVAETVVKCGDPVVAWDTSGHAFYFALTERTDGIREMIVWRFNDPDDGTGAIVLDPGVVIDTGSSGAKLDKNSLIFQPDATPGGDPDAPGTLYACYSSFQGTASNNIKVLCAISRDGGATWSLPNQGKYNGNLNSNNGTAAAPGPDESIYLFWRAFSSSENGYYLVKVDPDGNATTPVQVVGGPDFHPYDPPTLSDLARSNAFPAVASNGDQEILLAFQAYSHPDGFMAPASLTNTPRIFVTYSADGGTNWSSPEPVDYGPHGNTHQFMPSAAYVGGLWSVTFYDARNDGCSDQEGTIGDSNCGFGRPPDPEPVTIRGVPQYFPRGRDRRFDLRVAQGVFDDALGELSFNSSTQVTGYQTSAVDLPPSLAVGDIVHRDPNCPQCGPALNYPFLPVGAGGTVSWMGDYIAHIAKKPFLRNTDPSGPAWRYTGPGDPTTTLAFWADFRGVAFPGGGIDGTWTLFNPLPNSLCANPRSRDVDVLFSEITNGGLSASVKSTAVLPGIPPEFTVQVQNLSGTDLFFRLEIADGASAVPPALAEDWSMVQPPPLEEGTDLNEVNVKILANSSVTKTVYYRLPAPSTPVAPVLVQIFETTGRLIIASSDPPQDCPVPPFPQEECVLIPGGSEVPGGLATSVTYNVRTASLATSVLHGVAVGTPVVEEFSLTGQPSNKFIENKFIENKFIENKFIENKFIENKFIENKFIENSLVEDQQVRWTVTGAGALTTAGTTFSNVANGQELLEDGWIFQLLIYQTQSNPYTVDLDGLCVQVPIETDIVLSNIAITEPNKFIENKFIENHQVSNKFIENKFIENKFIENSLISDQVSNATFSVDTGEDVHIALRAFKPPGSSLTFDPVIDENIGEAVFGQANDPLTGDEVGAFFDTTPPVITPIATGTLGENGWYVSDVTVSWTVIDAQSGIVSTTGCETVTLTEDTAGETLECSAVNRVDLDSFSSVTIKIDKTPPTIVGGRSPGANGDGWNNSDVTVSFVCSDLLSGLAAGSPPADTVLSGESANQSATGTCTDRAGSSAAATVSGINIDKTPPIVTITQPVAGGSYLLNSSDVSASYLCADVLSGIATCLGTVPDGSPFDTSTVGSHEFTATATDIAGNSAAQINTYFVGYDFVLTPPKSPSKLNNSVPLTWKLKDANGVAVTELSSLIRLTSHFTPGVQPVNGVCPIAHPGTTVVPLYAPATGATGGSDFRLLQARSSFRFNLDTKTSLSTGPGCYTLVWQFDDNAGPSPDFEVLEQGLLRAATIELK